MKKQIFTMLLLLVFVIQGYSQISISRADFPEIGNLVVSAVDNTSSIDPGQPGQNQTWDFSNLTASSYDSTYYISPAGAPHYQNYPEANIVSNHNPLQFPNGYNINYWNFSDTDIKGVADETLINLFGTFYLAMYIKYTPPSSNLTFPFTYGSTKSETFIMYWITASRMDGITTDSMKTVSHVALSCLVDASGTMILPDGSFPVLRAKETWNSTDTTYEWNGTAWVYSSDTVSSWNQYKWYANNYGEIGSYNPSGKKANGFTFFKSETLVGMENHKAPNAFTLYPNPATSQVSISSGEPFDRIEISDNTGRTVLVSGNQKTIDVSSLAAGAYIVRLIKGNSVQTGKLCKQ
jgi:hypothetical protein